MKRVIWAAVGVTAFVVVGFLVSSRFTEEQPQQVSASSAAPAVVTDDKARAELAEAKRRASELEVQLKAEREVNKRAVETIGKLDAQVHARGGKLPPPGADSPVPFPNSVPDAFLPRHAREVADDIAKNCKMKLAVLDVDCAEYPCIIWTRATDKAVTEFSMSECEPWKKAYGELDMVFGSGFTKEGEQVFAWAPVPPDETKKVASFRAPERVKAFAAGRYDFPDPNEASR